MFLIIVVISLVFSTVMKCKNTNPTHFVVFPTASVQTSVVPTVNAESIYHIILEIPLVDRTIFPHKFTFPLFYSIYKFSFVLCSIYPDLYSIAALFIVNPVPFISSTICMEICSLSICVIDFPFTEINVPISMNKSTF